VVLSGWFQETYMARPLAQELYLYQKHFEEWREQHLGHFVLIKGSDVLGFYPSLDEAFRAGSAKYGLEDFFIHQIVPDQQVNVTFLGQSLST
jgi:hypothetical protein